MGTRQQISFEFWQVLSFNFQGWYRDLLSRKRRCWKQMLGKDLGLIVQNDLKWNRHFDNACSTGFKFFYMIKRNVSNLPHQSKVDLYERMIIPSVLYASCWFGLSMYVSSQLESSQKRIVQWILGKIFSYKEALNKLKLLPLMMYLQPNDVLMLPKLIQGHHHLDMRLPVMNFPVRGELKFNSERPSKT